MDKKIVLENGDYKIVKSYKDGFCLNDLLAKWTDFFFDYDYIVGDYAYDKLRLKGFCEKENTKCNSINHKNLIEDYIQNDCAYECRYFILKKISNN